MIKEKKLNSVQPKQTRDINDGQTLLWTIRLEYNIFFSYYYNSAIKIWSISDVEKRNTAKQNNLNYLEIFSCDLNECIQLFEQKVNNIIIS